MAFPVTPGYGNLPQGNFSPTIYSKKAQLTFRKVSVCQAITNTEYYGEIKEMGDTVQVIKEPTITVGPYARGQNVSIQDLNDDSLSLVIDQANYFAFAIDDIERKHAHHNWEAMASDRGAYSLRDAFDQHVLSYMASNTASARTLGSTGTPLKVNFDGAYSDTEMTPTLVLNRLGRLLDQQNVPHENRWAVVDPIFCELLRHDSSKLINNDYVPKGVLNNGLVTTQLVQGFKLYMSNNLPSGGTGPVATSSAGYGYIMAGHISSTATAENIKTTEKLRAGDTFADIVRGLHVFGRKLLRTESITRAIWNSGT